MMVLSRGLLNSLIDYWILKLELVGLIVVLSLNHIPLLLLVLHIG
jgi:hypothetical protein